MAELFKNHNCKNGDIKSSSWIDEEPRKFIHDLRPFMKNVPSHYKGNIDFIEYFFGQSSPDEIRGAMKFTIGKYATRLGRKDEEIQELDKIIDYAQRYKKELQKRKGENK